MNITKIEILRMLYKGRPTIPEMSERVSKAYATVHKSLQELVEVGMVQPPRFKGAARDYRITEDGIKYLKTNKYIK
jgi:predicted transcriptional regulator